VISVFPSMFSPAWPRFEGDDAEGLDVCRAVGLDEFQAPQDTDAMCVAYAIDGEPMFPRLKACAPRYVDGIHLTHVFLDWDRPNHEAWPGIATARSELSATLRDLGDPAFGGYTSRAGFRLFAKLDEPVPVDQANKFLEVVRRRVERATGLAFDPASDEWTRLFRLPRARRDGEVLDSFVVDPLSTFSVRQVAHDLEAWTPGRHPELQNAGDAPDDDIVLTPAHRAACRNHVGVPDGPLPASRGKSYRDAVRSAMGSIAALGSISDPRVLFTIFRKSAEDPPVATGLDLADLWKLAAWVATRQAQTTPEVPVAPTPTSSPAAAETSGPRLPPLAPAALPAATWDTIERGIDGRLRSRVLALRSGASIPGTKSTKLTNMLTMPLRMTRVIEGLTAEQLYSALFHSARADLLDTNAIWDACLRAESEASAKVEAELALQQFTDEHGPLFLSNSRDGMYVFKPDTRSYVPVGHNSLRRVVERDLNPHLPADVDPLRDFADLVAEYGEHFDDEERWASLDHDEWVLGDHGRGVLRTAAYTRSAFETIEHGWVDEWLQLLGCSNPGKLLDWLSQAPRLDMPLAALYIKGGPGIGKSLLGRALGELWSAPAVPYDAVGSSFNGGLAKCPVVVADEGITDGSDRASETFRSLVSNKRHELRRKYQASSTLYGALRVVIFSNDDNGIPFAKPLGAEGLEAVTERILYLAASHETRARLAARFAEGGTDTEVCREICEHLTWMAETRTVVPGSRFLVSGEPTPWHDQFAVNQGIKPDVLQACWWLLRHRNANVGSPRAWFKGDMLYVRTDAITAAWSDAVGPGKPPRPKMIRDALGQLGTNKLATPPRGTRCRAYEVPAQALVDAGVCEKEDIEQVRKGDHLSVVKEKA